MGFLTFLFSIAVYFLPSIVAYSRQHPRRDILLILNLFFGVTGLGWVLILLYSALSQTGGAGAPAEATA